MGQKKPEKDRKQARTPRHCEKVSREEKRKKKNLNSPPKGPQPRFLTPKIKNWSLSTGMS